MIAAVPRVSTDHHITAACTRITPHPDAQRPRAEHGAQARGRCRERRDQPWSLDTSVLPARRFPGLLSEDLTGSLYTALIRGHGLTVDRAEETVEATTATGEQARALGIAEGSGLLEIHRITYDEKDSPAEYAHDFFRADRTRMHMQKVGTNWKRLGRN